MIRTVVTMIIVLLATVAAGCAATGPAEPPAGPRVTVDGARGPVTIPVTDQRIWALDESTALQLLSVGVTASHAGRNAYVGDQLVEATYRILIDAGVPLAEPGRPELIAAAEPELIIGTNFPGHAELLPQLERIAPVLLIDDNAPWATQLAVLGAATGHHDQADAVTRRLQARTEALAAAIKESPYAGATVSVLSTCGQQVCVYGDARAFGGLLADLGLRRPPAQQDQGNAWGYRSVSFEVAGEHRGEAVLSLVGSVNFDGRPLLDHPLFDTTGLRAAEVDFGAWFGAGPLNVLWMLADLEAVLIKDGPTTTAADGPRLWQELITG